MESTYRFIRSKHVSAEDIANVGFVVTAAHTRDHSLLLALEDPPLLTFNHASVKDLRGQTNQGGSCALQGHSMQLFAPREHRVVDLAAQQIWTHDVSKRRNSLRPAPRRRICQGAGEPEDSLNQC